MASQVIFKMDKRLKAKAMRKARKEGLAFASVLKLAAKAYVDGALEVQLVAQPRLNAKTRRELLSISRDLRQRKNLSPSFDGAKDAIAYLKSFR